MRPSTAACAILAFVLVAGAVPARAATATGSGAQPIQHDHVAPPPAAVTPPPAAPTATVAVQTPEVEEIDRLLGAMNAAQGDAKVALMADLIARLVAERRPASSAGSCPMCAAKMAGKTAGMAAGTPLKERSALENDEAPSCGGCSMKTHK